MILTNRFYLVLFCLLFTPFFLNLFIFRYVIRGNMYVISQFLFWFQQRSRDHKEKLTLQDLMIMPVQRIPRYVLIITVSYFRQCLFFLCVSIDYDDFEWEWQIPIIQALDLHGISYTCRLLLFLSIYPGNLLGFHFLAYFVKIHGV